MAENFKTFSGTRIDVERRFNDFLQNLDGTYNHVVMTGTEDHLVLGVIYNDASTSNTFSRFL